MTWSTMDSARVYSRVRVASCRVLGVPLDRVLDEPMPRETGQRLRRLVWWVCRELGLTERMVAALADVDRNTVREQVDQQRRRRDRDRSIVAAVVREMCRMGGGDRREEARA